MHITEINGTVNSPDYGLLIGNGDLSASVYQLPGRLIWRLGKGDVWDRRHDTASDPAPAHIREVANGIENEGWVCGPYGGPVHAECGTNDPDRMRQICQGCPPSYERRPYPNPKPVGELALLLPEGFDAANAGEAIIRQRLYIEEARIAVECSWPSGARFGFECFIPPAENVIIISWTSTLPETVFSLYRWADPATPDFKDYRVVGGGVTKIPDPEVTPLPPPSLEICNGRPVAVKQTFYPDPLFTGGFKYLLTPLGEFTACDASELGMARVTLAPSKGAVGTLAVVVSTSSDKGGPAERLAEMSRLYDADFAAEFGVRCARLRRETLESARIFWARSAVKISIPALENLWYETLHASRCVYRGGTVPPGLFLPSTVKDYSHWHGDYHSNYNFQQPFWGFLTANHPELIDSYCDGMRYFEEIGLTIARDYYDARGMFIQLSGYPIKALADPISTVPMGRMAYMTGWSANIYWWRYLYTRDKAWLRSTGYPFIRDCALFYTDFLKLGDDGLYHAFPSNVGEDGFSGDPAHFRDRAQVMRHARYLLRAAIAAAGELGVDTDLVAEWRDRLEKCAGDDGAPPAAENLFEQLNPPEYGHGVPFAGYGDDADGGAEPLSRDELNFKDNPHMPEYLWDWYFGQYPMFLMPQLRTGRYKAGRDMPYFIETTRKWRAPNGLYIAMSPARYGCAGAWTESLGIIAPLQEMMLQSWDGALRVFPAWPADVEAEFTDFAAEGGFLVSASWRGEWGCVDRFEVKSLKGGVCAFYPPWAPGAMVTRAGAGGGIITTREDSEGRTCFDTVSGSTYIIEVLQL